VAFYAVRKKEMHLTLETLVAGIKLFNQHFDIDTPLKQHQFILGGDQVGLVSRKYASTPGGVITIYLRRNPVTPSDVSEKYLKLLGLFSGETLAIWGGVTEITIQINEYTFKVKPQPADHEDLGFDTVSRIIEVFG
jgi:hypothetical protein